jgi:hypothetical protein
LQYGFACSNLSACVNSTQDAMVRLSLSLTALSRLTTMTGYVSSAVAGCVAAPAAIRTQVVAA